MKNWGMKCPKGALKNSDVLLESRLPHACSGLCAYPGKPKNTLISHLWLTLRRCTSRKLNLRQSYKVPTGAFNTCSNTQDMVSAKAGRRSHIKHLRKSLSNHELTTRLTKWSHQWSDITKNTNFT